MAWTDADIDGHQAVLAERVFQTETKWPHFRLLLRDIRAWGARLAPAAVVVCLERTLLYGGFSLVAPFFQRQKFISVDCSPPSADERGEYNSSMIDDRRFIRIPFTRRAPIEETGLADNLADLVLVPNLVHHVRDQKKLFDELARVVKPGGTVYVFEPTLRELHQIPDDFLRYTPFGIQTVLRESGLEPRDVALEGGPFSAIAYCWTQALQYVPPQKRAAMEEWFYGTHFRELLAWDEAYPRNLDREHTSFPVSFSIEARKPA